MRVACVISGMVAVHAKHAVLTALSGVPGIVRAEVALGRAEVEFTAGISPDDARAALEAAVEAGGYQVTRVTYLRNDLPTLREED